MEINRTCAYLDILGFRTFIEVNRDLYGAVELINYYQNVLNLTNMAAKVSAARTTTDALSCEDEALRNRNLQLKFTTFEHFLPTSDSIFIQSSSEDRGLFVAQISSFLLKCLTLIRPMPKFPLLLRGGIAYGECCAMPVTSILNNTTKESAVLAGMAVAEAVRLEGRTKGDGPMLLCSKSFYEALPEETRKYIKTVGDQYIILWPAFYYYDACSENHTDFRHEQEFDELFGLAANWWKEYNHLPYGSHYYGFLKLIIESTLKYYSVDGRHTGEARKYIEKAIEENGLSSKAADLMKTT